MNANSLNRDKKINGFDTTQEIKDVRVLDEIIKEPQVETEPTSVSEPEAQEITYDGLCEMIKSSSLPNETKNNLKNSLNSEYINVENIPDIISAVKAETLKEKHEHNLVCSLLKFLINKGIDGEHLTAFKRLIKHLIKNSVLTPNDHSIVFDALNIIDNNPRACSWTLAAIAINKEILTEEEQDTYYETAAKSIMLKKGFDSILDNLWREIDSQRKNILYRIIDHEELSEEQLFGLVSALLKYIVHITDGFNSQNINVINDSIAKDGILMKLLYRINDKKPKNTAIIHNFASILYSIMEWIEPEKNNKEIESLKEPLKKLLLDFKPTLQSYNLRHSEVIMPDGSNPLWTEELTNKAKDIGIEINM